MASPDQRRQELIRKLELVEKLEAADKVGGLQSPAAAEKREPSTSQVQAGVESFGNAVTLGYAPQLQAMAEPLVDRAMNFITGQKVPEAPLEQALGRGASYVKARDENIRRMAEQEKDYPLTTGAASVGGTVAGALATPIGTASTAGKGLLAAAKGIGKGIGKVALVGGAQAALQNPGDTEGNVDPLQLAERGENAKKGAAISAATAGLVKGGGTVASKFAGSGKAAKEIAENAAFKSSGAMLKDFRSAADKGRVNEVGRWMLDNKIVQATDSVDEVATKAAAFKESTGKELGALYKKAQAKLAEPKFAEQLGTRARGFRPKSDSAEILGKVQSELGDSVGAKAATQKVAGYLEELTGKYGDDVDIRKANDIIGKIDEQINYSRRSQDLPEVQQAFLAARRFIRERVNNQVKALDRALGSADSARLKQLNSDYRNASDVVGMAQDRALRENANQMFSLTDKIAAVGGGGAGAVTGAMQGGDLETTLKGAALGAGAGLVNRVGRTRGAGLIAGSANRTSGFLDKTAVPLGRAGELLMSRPDVAARTAVGEAREKPKDKERKPRGLIRERVAEKAGEGRNG